LPGALVSTVNLAEVVSKLCERAMPAKDTRNAVETIRLASPEICETAPDPQGFHQGIVPAWLCLDYANFLR